MQNQLLTALLVLAVSVGCSRKEDIAGVAAPAAAMSKEPGQAARRFMAYEHVIDLDTEEGRVVATYESAQASCAAAADDQCVILESSLRTGQNVHAHLKFRARPGGIRKLIAELGTQGNVISQATTAEDLARPLEDSAKKLEMLQNYRSKLEMLQKRASSDIDALIKVNKELAQVESEIEAISGEKARLVRRVETEILNVDIGSRESQSFWKPVAISLSEFARNLSDGVASVVTGLAYMLPWGLTIAAFVWGGRKLWIRRRRMKAGP